MSRLKKFDIRQAFGWLLLVVVLGFVANALALVFLVRPVSAEYAALRDESQDERKIVENRRRQVESKEAFLLAVAQAETDLDTLRNEKLSTRKRRMVSVGYELHRLADEHGVNMSRVVYQNSKLPDEELDRYGMVVPLEGGYKNLRRFIANVERSNEWFVIEQIRIGQGQQSAAALLMNITLATYFDDPVPRPDATDSRRAPAERAAAGTAESAALDGPSAAASVVSAAGGD